MQDQSVRAAGRIGVGTLAAMGFHHYVELPDAMHAAMTGLIILVVNELAYVGGLAWRHFVKRVEDWS